METPFARRFAVRFGAVASLLFFFPSPLDAVPKLGDAVSEGVASAWLPLVKLAGRLLGTAEPTHNLSGSGDTLFDWLRLACVLLLAVVLGLAWAAADKRTSQQKLEDVLLDYLRLMLMIAMFTYGWAKVTLSQFPELVEFRLSQTYAESSPMGLLWRFMAFSPTYQRFAGGLEVLSAVLLISRRTATLGALVAMGVMTNVVMLNFCFDVPVKNYSAILLLTAAVLAAPSAKRLFKALVLGEAVEAADWQPKYLATGKLRWARMAPFGLFAVLSLAAFMPNEELEEMRHPKGPFNGEYTVVDQTAGARAQAVSLTDWAFKLRPAEGPLAVWKLEQSAEKNLLTLSSFKDPSKKFELKFEPAGDGRFRVSGEMNEAPLDLLVSRVALQKGNLFTRGFHWVSEFPVNN